MKTKSATTRFALKERRPLTADTVWLAFRPLHHRLEKFTPGQYVTIYFEDSRFGWQGKSYSIASIPARDGSLAIAVKKIGDFSGALHNMRPGDSVKIVGPTGYFYPVTPAPLIFIAAGIGIAPFYSILKTLEKKNRLPSQPVMLLYSNKTKSDIAFLEELNTLAAKYENLKIVHFLTRSDGKDADVHEFQRIDAAAIKKYIATPKENSYFICGSISFVNDLWRMLKDIGIQEEKIITEAFY